MQYIGASSNSPCECYSAMVRVNLISYDIRFENCHLPSAGRVEPGFNRAEANCVKPTFSCNLTGFALFRPSTHCRLWTC